MPTSKTQVMEVACNSEQSFADEESSMMLLSHNTILNANGEKTILGGQ